MPFGFPTATSGDFLPIVKFNATDGKIFRVESTAVADGYEREDVEITKEFSAVMDLENIQAGWVYFQPGAGPRKVLSNYGKNEPLPPRPEDKGSDGKPLFKNALNIRMALSQRCGGGIYETTPNSALLMSSFASLYDQYVEERAKHPGQLPVVKCAGSRKEEVKYKGGKNNYYRFHFVIDDWADRPAKLVPPEEEKPAVSNGNGAHAFNPTSAPSTGSTVKAPPPVKMPKSEPEAAAADDFG